MGKTKILIIEDDLEVCDNIINLLSEFKYDVFSAKSGEEGIRKAVEIIPELIICDIMMKNLDGYQVLKEISTRELLKYCSFIFLTAKVSREDYRRGMELGADDYLFKPYKATELLKAVEVRLAKRDYVRKYAGGLEIQRYSYDDIIFVNLHDSPENLRISDIVCILADNQYTVINTKTGKRIITRKSITKWISDLPNKDFLQIHRSVIINANYIVKMEKWFNNSFRIFLKYYDEALTVSKRFASRIRNRY